MRTMSPDPFDCPPLIARLVVLPSRSGRVEPRVRKRRPKEFPLMKKPRAELRKALLEQALTP